MTESSELKEVAKADLLDASRVCINWEQTRPAIIGVSRWNARERHHQSLSLELSYMSWFQGGYYKLWNHDVKHKHLHESDEQ